MLKCDTLYYNAQIATFSDQFNKGYGIIEDGSIAITDGKISWVGKTKDLERIDCDKSIDLNKKWVTPGLIDCHTHIIYAGNRSNEFEDRLEGVSYKEISEKGGGILSTVLATRACSNDELLKLSLNRVENLLSEGVTTLEIKSGYGLDYETERKMLMTAREISNQYQVHICKTFLGAHSVAPEYKDRADEYIQLICHDILPKLHQEGLVDAVDAFCETIGFSVKQVEQLFNAAQKLQLPVKLHAEQLSNLEGAGLVADYQGLSADHLEYLSGNSLLKMKASNTVAVLLPGAFYTLRETKLPPIKSLLEKEVPIAISTDCNPGTSPIPSLLTVMNMACTLFKLTPEQVIAGVTKHAAQALNLGHRKGKIEIGYDADMVIWEIDRPVDLCYQLGIKPKNQVIIAGKKK